MLHSTGGSRIHGRDIHGWILNIHTLLLYSPVGLDPELAKRALKRFPEVISSEAQLCYLGDQFRGVFASFRSSPTGLYRKTVTTNTEIDTKSLDLH